MSSTRLDNSIVNNTLIRMQTKKYEEAGLKETVNLPKKDRVDIR